MGKVRAIDLFCGAGGCSWGARNAGVEIVAGFDMWKLAGQVFAMNFPEARFIPGRLENHRPLRKLTAELGRIDLLLASPECTNHSVAKGAAERCNKSRNTAFQVIRFARAFEPRWIMIENVVGMRNWDRFNEFIDDLDDLGYKPKIQTLDSSRFGVPQKRRRLFIIGDREAPLAEIGVPKVESKTARHIVDRNGSYAFTPLRTEGRAKATLARAERAIASLGQNKPFLIVYYGSDAAGGWQSLDAPLRTITTIDRFSFVKPSRTGHVMRMLQVPELKAAMGMPKRFRIDQGTRRNRIMMVGNSVCPPVIRRITNQLIRS